MLVSLHLQWLWTDPLASARWARWGPGVSQPALLGAPGLCFPWIAPRAHGFLSWGACGANMPLHLVARGPVPAAGCGSGLAPFVGLPPPSAGASATVRGEPGDQLRGHLGGPLRLHIPCGSAPGSRVGECRSPEGVGPRNVRPAGDGVAALLPTLPGLGLGPDAAPPCCTDFPDQAPGHHA